MMKILLPLFFIYSLCLQAQQYTWSTLAAPAATTGRYDDIFFLNENVGWAARGGSGRIYKTTDAGSTWVQLSLPNPTIEYYRNIEFLNENIGFLGTLNNSFYKTTDGGTSWQKVLNISPAPPAICGLDAVGTSTVYGCGAYFSPAYVIKSTDSGNTWQYIDMSAHAEALVEILFIDENTGFVSGNDSNGAVILKTADGGASWTKIYSGVIANEYVWKMQILPGTGNTKMFCSIESVAPNPGKLLKTADGGATWQTKVFPDVDVQAVGFITENKGWMGGHNTGFYETNDGGTTWTNLGMGGSLNRIFFINNTAAFASGHSIYKMNATNLSTTETNGFAAELKVEIVPNPVKNKLNLTVDFVHSDHLLIGLYDGSGKFLGNILKDDIPKRGKKIYTLDFPYPSGVYHLNIHSNIGRMSKKLIKE